MITDSIFNSFLAYITDKKYDYKTKSEIPWRTFKKIPRKKNISMQSKLSRSLKTQMENDKKS